MEFGLMWRGWLAVMALLFCGVALQGQQAGQPPQSSQPPRPSGGTAAAPVARHAPPHPRAQIAPGGGPDKVWLNLASAKYHCYGDRYYGRTANGRYMTEAAAKVAGAKGPRGQSCPAVAKG